ncbi:VOC family protein [Pelagovum pacificum]|uniref:VOC family protein n=1 Tax=Pelagovum pacificum TaxID=2588711 RepID=A0A5C5GDS9_9RHOB|nr:VOC family protein [Pelagovum pacificum]QQA43998.1 VOC family protein [Pelagovum pacificum]TNY32873.1 VOC family protein [Pelagovum pacificum]
MARVTGIGGVFFRSNDPAALAAWYHEHLGIDPVSETGAWTQAAGPTVFAPFSQGTDYFGDPAQQFMINFRVDDLKALTAQLEAAGITVETREEWDMPEIGTFARIHDPDGNPIELWQPADGI